MVIAKDLQHHEAGDQHQRERRDDHGGGERAALEDALLAPVILDPDGTHVGSLRGQARAWLRLSRSERNGHTIAPTMGWIQRHDEDADCSVHPWMPQTTTSATVSIANTNNDC
jgi:hypothetical protein